jgi:hypothetical protein
MTAHNPFQTNPGPLQRAVFFYSFQGIGGTRRMIAAGRWKKRGDGYAVGVNHKDKRIPQKTSYKTLNLYKEGLLF